MEQGYVQYHCEDGVGTIEFYHPSHNSLPGHLLAELARTITRAGADEQAVVLVLKSGGDRTFCAGASFDELIAINDAATGKQFFMGFARVINACRKCPKLLIGRVQGKTVGGGVGVAAAMDYCMASTYASIRLSELAVGIGPFVVGPAVERKVGISSMSQLTLTPQVWQSAQWALQKGLYTEVFDDNHALDQAVQARADELKQYNPAALAHLKRIFWEDCQHWDTLLEDRAITSGQLVLSDFSKSAIAQFKSK